MNDTQERFEAWLEGGMKVDSGLDVASLRAGYVAGVEDERLQAAQMGGLEERFEARLMKAYPHNQLSADEKRFALNNFEAGYSAGAEDMRGQLAQARKLLRAFVRIANAPSEKIDFGKPGALDRWNAEWKEFDGAVAATEAFLAEESDEG
jgi:hypothetical protein